MLQMEIVLIFRDIASKVVVLKVWSRNPWSLHDIYFCGKEEPQGQKKFHNNIETLSFYSHSFTSIKRCVPEAVCIIATG